MFNISEFDSATREEHGKDWPEREFETFDQLKQEFYYPAYFKFADFTNSEVETIDNFSSALSSADQSWRPKASQLK